MSMHEDLVASLRVTYKMQQIVTETDSVAFCLVGYDYAVKNGHRPEVIQRKRDKLIEAVRRLVETRSTG